MAAMRARPTGAPQQVRQVLVLVLLVRRRRGPRPPRHQGGGRPRLGPVPQHPAREAHLERPRESYNTTSRCCIWILNTKKPNQSCSRHDEQLLVPGEGERVQASQGRDRARVRAPDSAGQPDGRVDGATELRGAACPQEERLHPIHEHVRQGVLHVGGAQAQHQGLGLDRRPRPRLRLHRLPQGPPRRRRQHPHQRRLRLHRGLRRHPLRQGQVHAGDLPRRRSHHHRLHLRRLQPRRQQPRPPRHHHRVPPHPTSTIRAPPRPRPPREDPVQAPLQGLSLPRRPPLPLRPPLQGQGAGPSRREAHLPVRHRRRQALHACLHPVERRGRGGSLRLGRQGLLQGRPPQVPPWRAHVAAPRRPPPRRLPRREGPPRPHRVPRPWHLPGGRRAEAAGEEAGHDRWGNRDHTHLPGDAGGAQGPGGQDGDARGVRQPEREGHPAAGGAGRVGEGASWPGEGVVRGERGQGGGVAVQCWARDGGDPEAARPRRGGRRAGARLRAAPHVAVRRGAQPGEDGL
uniref:Uncharacterized protein n=1 Tax=Anthurium amnicola TaxID=1678845 RepID=A0A1D1XMM2_9ARAE